MLNRSAKIEALWKDMRTIDKLARPSTQYVSGEIVSYVMGEGIHILRVYELVIYKTSPSQGAANYMGTLSRTKDCCST